MPSIAEKRPDTRASDARPAREREGAVTGDRKKTDPLIGQVVNGRFEILSLIARGGMGKVYQAEQAPLGRICAIKVLSPKYDGTEDPEFQRRFYLEASTAAKLTHPNTVTIFDYGRDEQLDLYYIAMEYVRGRTLFRVLREEGTLAEHRVAHVIREVGRSLREAHALGVIHRDMKPANVVLVESEHEQDTVKVLDFGLVKDVSGDDAEDLTQQGLFMGSPKYMAPEQILGNPVSPATDVYALGVLAYELLTGQVPFDRGSSVKTLMAHVNDTPRSMRAVNPRVYLSAAMNAIVMRCLEKDPASRYASIDELLRALTRVEGGGTLTDSLLAGPIVKPPPPLLDVADPLESNPTERISRSAAPGSSTAHGATAPRPGGDSATTAATRRAFDELLGPSDPSPPRPSSPPGHASMAPLDSMSPLDSMPPESVSPRSLAPDSLRPSVHPSGTPEPMEQLAFDELALPKRSRTPVVVALAAVGLVGAVAVGFALESSTAETAAAQPSPTSSPSAASTATPDGERSRVVRVRSEPSGARVAEGERVLCEATPCDIAWSGTEASATHELTLTLDGHAPTKVATSVDATEVSATLATVVTPPGSKSPPAPSPFAPAPKLGAPPKPAAPAPAPKSETPAPRPKLSGYKDSPY